MKNLTEHGRVIECINTMYKGKTFSARDILSHFPGKSRSNISTRLSSLKKSGHIRHVADGRGPTNRPMELYIADGHIPPDIPVLRDTPVSVEIKEPGYSADLLCAVFGLVAKPVNPNHGIKHKLEG